MVEEGRLELNASDNALAVVTGASRGIGQAVAIELAARGLRVLATMRNAEAAGPLLANEAISERIEIAELDVCDPGSFRLPDSTAVLVNNAGGMETDRPFEHTTDDEWRRVFDLNLFATMNLTRQAIPIMRARGGGVICNFSTAATLQPTPWVSAYRAAKAAVSALNDSLRIELSPFGIRIVEIVPALVDTDALRQTAAFRPPDAAQYDEYSAMALATERGFDDVRHLAATPAQAAHNIADVILADGGPMRHGCDRLAQRALTRWRLSSDEELFESFASGSPRQSSG